MSRSIHTVPVSEAEVLGHFTARAERYNASSHWCNDEQLAARFLGLVAPRPSDRVLDVACGTGLWAKTFRGRVAEVVGVDVTPAMYEQARPWVDLLVVGPAEKLPFAAGQFDITTERQGIQFTDARQAVSEMARVTRPGGKVTLVQLCAYGAADRDEYFHVLQLRNPARRNFFVRDDLRRLLEDAGCHDVRVHDYVSEEDVDCWSDNGAIPEARREAIREAYRNASAGFRASHGCVEHAPGRFTDRMLFGIAVGIR